VAYEWERDEWRAAARYDTELAQAAGCGHEYGVRGVCRCCGDNEPASEWCGDDA